MRKTTLFFLLLSILTTFFNSRAQAQCHRDDWTALKALYESTNGENWTNRAGWDMYIAYQLIPPNSCDLANLYGIQLDSNGRVSCIDLDGEENCGSSEKDGNNLEGILPPELGKLDYLNKLFLLNNKLKRSIPAELGYLTKLNFCNLENNQLTGSIPPEVGSLTNLVYLSLSNNQLDGNIPLELYNLTKLENLWLSENELTDSILPEIKKLKNLKRLSFWSNQLTGTIPAEIGSLTDLTYLSLTANQFTGSLPIEMGNLSNLDVLKISSNNFTGCYPANFNRFCTQLGALDRGTNSFISEGNSFDVKWEDFCATGAGSCALSEELLQCHMDDWTALKALYDSTGGDNWINRTGWDVFIAGKKNPPDNCDLDALFGVTTTNGRVTCIDMDGEVNCGWSKSDAGGNNLMGNLPPELGKLKALSFLRLSYNKLTGNIPIELQSLNNLAILELDNNELNGNIPAYIGNFVSLIELHLYKNKIEGHIPTEIANLTNLKQLGLGVNNLTGNIPEELGSLTKLDYLGLRDNEFSGIIPESFKNLTKLKYLTLSQNDHLKGNILDIILNFPELEFFQAYYNDFTGSIPPSINSLTKLKELLLTGNEFSGTLPAELGDLDRLTLITLGKNDFEGCYPSNISNFCSFQKYSDNTNISDGNNFNAAWEDFCATSAGSCLTDSLIQCRMDDWTALKALYDSTGGDNWINRTGWDMYIANQSSPPANCNLANLYGIQLDDNKRVTCIDMDGIPDCHISNDEGGNNLTGKIPHEINKLKHLKWLSFFYNNLSGNLPVELFELDNLEILGLRHNDLSGEIPQEIGNLHRLIHLNLDHNDFTGNIPVGLTELSRLIWCDLSVNKLTGKIPPEIGNLSKLESLKLVENQLSGNIPDGLYDLTKLRKLFLYTNELEGTISSKIENLKKLENVAFYENLLTGVIPPEIGSLCNLTLLKLSHNQLTGSLPIELMNLKSLNTLEISHNNLTGCYPENFNIFCTQLAPEEGKNSDISDGNNFDATWEDFCNTGEDGACPPYEHVPTNYSGYVSLSLDNEQNILKNKFAIVYDYSVCSNYSDLANCVPVSGYENKSANEAFWTVTKAAEYFSSYFDIELPVVNIVVNSTNDPNRTYFYHTSNVIELGAGDGVERNSMSAPDITAHEYLHFLQHNLDDFFSPLKRAGEPGALRESMADIFGEIIEYQCYGENDWIIASQVMSPKSTIQGIRSLSHPTDSSMKHICPDTYLETPWIDIGTTCDFTNDRCGIHTNCSVHNYWFYILADNIGFDAATNIVFENFTEHLDSTSTYTDAAIGSIKAVEELYGGFSQQQNKVIEAWHEVGISLEELDIDLNFIQWWLEVDTIAFGDEMDTVKLNLVIDSVGQDISADSLNFTLHLDQTHQELTEDDIIIHPPLNIGEVQIEIDGLNINVKIDRKPTENSQKTQNSYQKIKSSEPVLGFVLCIPVVDAGESYCYQPIKVSGHTTIAAAQNINFRPDMLYLGSCIDKQVDNPIDGSEGFNLIYTVLDITQKNCYTLGTVSIEVLNYFLDDLKPYTYKLFSDGILIEDINSFEPSLLFDNLDEGYYTLELEDNNNGKAFVEFEIKFIAEMEEVNCCPENLIIPPGNVNGSYNATNTIIFENEITITEGEFEICD